MSASPDIVRPAPKRLLAVLLTAALTAALVLFGAGRSEAADTPPSILEGGYLISDGAFFNGSAMTAAQIQTFLNGKVPACASGYTCLKSYKADIAAKAADKYCKALGAVTKVPSATIIAAVGSACGISQKVLLVMLQKEQGLVTATAPTATRYSKAMGQACPDTAACDPRFAGFFNQVYGAAHQMKVYTLNPASFNVRAGQLIALRWSPKSTCGSAKVYIQNQATANLYNYTPYRPNVAALAAGAGTGDDCSAYGNRNFVNYWGSWFGGAATATPAKVPVCQGPVAGDIMARTGTMTVTAAVLNARTAPTTLCGTGLFTLAKGKTVTRTGAYGLWTRISTGGRTAWVATQYLSPLPTAGAIGPGTTCPLPSAASISAASGNVVVTATTATARIAPALVCGTSAATLVKGKVVARTGTYAAWTRISTGGRSLWMPSAYTAYVAPTSVKKTTTAALNVRSAPSMSASILFVLPKGAVVTVNGTSGAWSHIVYGSRTGWANSTYLK